MFLCGYKWTMFMAQTTFLVFIAANIYPKAWLMYPASALCGISRAAFGTAQSAYVAALGNSNESDDDTKYAVNKYFAIFFSALQSSQIWGNLISYIILQNDPNNSIPKNVTLCGANYLDSEQGPSARITKQISYKTVRRSTAYSMICALHS
ncbi:unnamed protein product [Rotaria sp. Silwood1]|nr:unnamed protein product [Rotaria sp. Silwood1]CAF1600031.1 unnamed protein product [Rotaria sp. Silwood1]CAF3761747.1 unnamed protein product [Rotaria sp. Silwood1]